MIQLWTADSLHQERVAEEGIEMHLNSCSIASDFKNQSTNKGSEEAPCTVLYTKEEVDKEEQRENGKVESVAR